jgi:hypothetical protein
MFLGGWVEVKAVLRIAYSNQKSAIFLLIVQLSSLIFEWLVAALHFQFLNGPVLGCPVPTKIVHLNTVFIRSLDVNYQTNLSGIKIVPFSRPGHEIRPFFQTKL